MDWFRWWHGTATDPKWRVIAKKSGATLPEVLGIWVCVTEAASVGSCGRGSIEGLDDDVIAATLDLDATRVRAVLDAMQGLVLEKHHLKAWEKRQPKREDSSAARMAKLRSASQSVTQRHVTHGDAARRPRYREERYKSEGGVAGGAQNGRVGVGNSQKRIDYTRPENRQHYATTHLTVALGAELVMAAHDTKHPAHASAVRQCRQAARKLKLTWLAPSDPGYAEVTRNLARTARGGPDFGE